MSRRRKPPIVSLCEAGSEARPWCVGVWGEGLREEYEVNPLQDACNGGSDFIVENVKRTFV